MSVEILNQLININDFRSEVYRKAYNRTDDENLKLLFNRNFCSSLNHITALSREITRLGETASEPEKMSYWVCRLYVEILLMAGERGKALLNACQYCEEISLNHYQEVMEDMTVTDASLSEILHTQEHEIKNALESLKRLSREAARISSGRSIPYRTN